MRKTEKSQTEQHCYWVWYDTNGGKQYESVLAKSFTGAIKEVGKQIAKAATTIWDVYTLEAKDVSRGTIIN